MSLIYNSETSYLVGDFVSYNSVLYVCIQNGNNKTPDTETAYWTPYIDVLEDEEQLTNINYNANKTYALRDVIQYNDRIWKSLQNSNSGNTPYIGSPYWERIAKDLGKDIELATINYNEYKEYSEDDIVNLNGELWKSTQDNNSGNTPGSNDDYWKPYLSLLCADDSTTFYVDATSGSDNNDGSSGSPFATIIRALEAIPQYVYNTGNNSTTIYLSGEDHSTDDLSLYLKKFKSIHGVIHFEPMTNEEWKSSPETGYISNEDFSTFTDNSKTWTNDEHAGKFLCDVSTEIILGSGEGSNFTVDGYISTNGVGNGIGKIRAINNDTLTISITSGSFANSDNVDNVATYSSSKGTISQTPTDTDGTIIPIISNDSTNLITSVPYTALNIGKYKIKELATSIKTNDTYLIQNTDISLSFKYIKFEAITNADRCRLRPNTCLFEYCYMKVGHVRSPNPGASINNSAIDISVYEYGSIMAGIISGCAIKLRHNNPILYLTHEINGTSIVNSSDTMSSGAAIINNRAADYPYNTLQMYNLFIKNFKYVIDTSAFYTSYITKSIELSGIFNYDNVNYFSKGIEGLFIVNNCDYVVTLNANDLNEGLLEVDGSTNTKYINLEKGIFCTAFGSTVYSGQTEIDHSATDAFVVEDSGTKDNVFKVDTVNGRVGIGTGSPSQALDLIGSLELEDTTTSTSGIIYKVSTPFIHNFHHPTGNTAVPLGNNTFVGEDAGNLTLGSTATNVLFASYNSGFGSDSLNSLTTGYYNTAAGFGALTSLTTGYYNSAAGALSLKNLSTGHGNSALGLNAGRYITGGSTANQTSNNSVYLGYNTKASADGNANEIVIGYDTTGNGSNTVTLGNSSITDTYLEGNINFSTIKTGSTQGNAGAAAGELWATSGHASLPDNVVMIGV